MSNTFYGEFIKEKFPERSRIRKDSSSTGAKLFDGLGSFIEKQYRSKMLQEKHSPRYCNSMGTSVLSKLYETEVGSNSTYQQEVNGLEVESAEITLQNDSVISCVKSLDELYNAHPESYNYIGFSFENTSVIKISDKNYIKEIAYIFKEEKELFINVQAITSTYKNIEKCYIKLCGKNIHGVPVEESIDIRGEGLYKTKTKFYSLEKIEKDKNITGGLPVNIYGLKTFELEILTCSAQSFVEGTDYRDESKSVKKKRIILNNYLSKSPNRKNIPNGFSDNDLVLELVNYEDENNLIYQSYFYYIHRHYENPAKVFSEENIEVEKEIFETVIGFTLLDEYLVDIEYSYDTNDIVGCTAEGVVHYYDIGMPVIPDNSVKRTTEVKLEIAFEDSYYLPSEEMVGRLITTNLDLPIYSFILGKIEGSSISFLNEDKTAFEEDITIFDALQEVEDLQDSIGSIRFDITGAEKSLSTMEFFTVCFQSNAINATAINKYNLSEVKDLEELFSDMEGTHINSRVLRCGYIRSKYSYELVDNDDAVIKNIYKVNANRKLFLVTEQDVHYEYAPDYNKHYYANQSIYSTESTSIKKVTFNMATGGSVNVNVV
jgi:hypothetical protein